MFLLLLLAYPGCAYALFRKFEHDPKELGGILKIIGLIGLSMLFFALHVLDGKWAYAATIAIWYAAVFGYFFFSAHSAIVAHSSEYEAIPKTDVRLGIIKLAYLFAIFLFYVTLYERDVGRVIRNLDRPEETLAYFLVVLVLVWIVFEIASMAQRTHSRLRKDSANYREKLKSEIRTEILAELWTK